MAAASAVAGRRAGAMGGGLQILPSGGTSAGKKKKKGKPGQGLEGGSEGGGSDGSSEDGAGLINLSEMLNRPDSREDGGDGGEDEGEVSAAGL